jgi:hypothetical protein
LKIPAAKNVKPPKKSRNAPAAACKFAGKSHDKTAVFDPQHLLESPESTQQALRALAASVIWSDLLLVDWNGKTVLLELYYFKFAILTFSSI